MGPTFMETTNYFKTHVMRKRPYIKMEWLEMAAVGFMLRKWENKFELFLWKTAKCITLSSIDVLRGAENEIQL